MCEKLTDKDIRILEAMDTIAEAMANGDMPIKDAINKEIRILEAMDTIAEAIANGVSEENPELYIKLTVRREGYKIEFF